ncbi:MAG: NAD(P)-binding protein [Campylobacterota bacterium]
MNIAIVGAGFSGCYLYSLLKEKDPKLDVKIFEKSRGTGGRLSTKYIENKFCDYGTPYFEATEPDFIYFCNKLVKKEILTKTTNTYIPKSGINKMCSALIDKNDLIKQTKIVSCEKIDKKYLLKDDNQNCYKNFDYVFITIPATQVLQHHIELQEDIKRQLKTVSYTSVATLILYSNKNFTINRDIQNSEFFKKVVNNSLKYNYNNFYSYVFHVNENYSTSNNYKSKDELKEEILNYIKYFQNSDLDTNIDKISHLWKYAFVEKRLKNRGFYLTLDKTFGLCGDYFKHKNLQGSFLSTKELFENLNL